MPRPVARTLAALAGTTALLGGLLVGAASPAQADNPVTPGNFTGYGFDQCLAPTQKAMDVWLKHSPFLSVGIYISGDSRACRSQPNLTKEWVATQLRNDWRLLPITLGPQASCSTRFPRYGDDETIKPNPGSNGKYAPARRQGRVEARSAVDAATALGIVPGSTLWYDLEGFDHTLLHCRESALAFLSGWTWQLHDLDYVSGVYSSVGSGIKILDDARVNRPNAFHLPDMIWLARWDGEANTSSSYIRKDGWRPGGRVKQYLGGHDETWGGVTINIDRNWLDVGKGSTAEPETHCDGVRVGFADYEPLVRGTKATARVKALQCLLSEVDAYGGRLTGTYNDRTIAAVRAWQEAHGMKVSDTWSRPNWMKLHVGRTRGVVKLGSAGSSVRRLQRALNSSSAEPQLRVNGVFNKATDTALRAYQRQVGLTASGVVAGSTWKALRNGRR